MKFILYKDNTVDVDVQGISEGINKVGTSISCSFGKQVFKLTSNFVECPGTYRKIPMKTYREADPYDRAICCTAIPYDNNYFIDYPEKLGILSFFAWNKVTNLPLNNGLVYFIATMIAHKLLFNVMHKTNTGCIHDFLEDKRGIDIGMRSAYVCQYCISKYRKSKTNKNKDKLLESLQKILDDLSRASRSNMDIIEYWKNMSKKKVFQVFICHNNADKYEVRGLNSLLKKSGISTWFDEEQLRPGLPWQEALETHISSVGAAAIFVGASNIGPWQNRELRAFITEFVERNCPVIPVLLKSVTSPPVLPLFLRQMMWVDLRKDQSVEFKKLIWGITGEKPAGI